MNFLDYTKEAYFHELARRDELKRSASVPIGVCVVTAGALYALLSSYDFGTCISALSVGVFVFLGGCVVFVIASIYFLAVFHAGYEYEYVPTAKELLDYRDKLCAFYERSGSTNDVSDDIVLYLVNAYANCAHRNATNNDQRSGQLYRANRSLVAAIVCLFISGTALLFINGVHVHV